MKTLLIATDFSSAGRNATKYWFAVAKEMRAKVILFTAYQTPAPVPDSSLYLSPKEMEKDFYERLSDEAEAIDPRRTVALETRCKEGPVYDTILAAALEDSASYIIVGMKERGKEIRKYFGSTVTHLFKTSHIPLIVVPENANFSIPKTIALASDIDDDTDIHILQPLKKVAEEFAASVPIVRVIKRSMDEAVERVMRSERLAWFLTGIKHSFEFIKAKDVAKGLNTFVEQHKVNML